MSLSLDICSKTQEEKDKTLKVLNQMLVGNLIYAVMCRRPDICYVVGLVSRFQSKSGLKHWIAIKRSPRYLRGTLDIVLFYSWKDLHLIDYSDVDWGDEIVRLKSTSRYAFLLNDGVISWSSMNQSCIALSTMETEYVTYFSDIQETIWLRRFLHCWDVVNTTLNPVGIDYDSMTALAYAKDPKYHEKTKFYSNSVSLI